MDSGFDIGFSDHLYTPLGTKGNYSSIAIPTLYSSLLHTLWFSVFTLHSPFPGNGFIPVSLSVQITHEVFFAQPNPFLAISQLPRPEGLYSVPLLQAHILAGWRLETQLT
jgi:hypothetical protein